jgi:hypothetical protein
VTADHTDANLVNRIWTADNGSGLSSLHNSAGLPQALRLTIPPAARARRAADCACVGSVVPTMSSCW